MDEEAKKNAEAFKVREGEFKEESQEPVIPPKETPKGEEPQFVPNPTWTILNEKFGVEVPKDLTPENEMEVLKTTMDKIKPEPVQLHPIAQELNAKLADPEFKFEDWVKQVSDSNNLINLTGKDFLLKAYALEFPDATPEDISQIVEDLEKSGMLKLQELEKKKSFKLQIEEQRKSFEQQTIQQQQKLLEEENKRVDGELTTLFANTKKIDEIYGIPISEAEKESFNKTFSELVRRDKEGKAPLMEMLQSNEDLWKFAYFILNGNQKLKEALFNAKEGTKAEIWKSLKTVPFLGPGNPAGKKGSDKPNYKVLTEPEK